MRGENKRWVRVKEDDGESVLDRAGIQDARFSSSPDTLKSFGRIQGRPHGAEDARHSSGCARDCLKELQVVHLHSRCHRIRKSAESRYCILSCILSSRAPPASSILYAPLQACIQHMHILGHSLHLTMMHTCLFSFHRNHSPSIRSLVYLCKTCNVLHVTGKKR